MANKQPQAKPRAVPIIPIRLPHIKKTLSMVPCVKPIVLSIAISFVLFFTSITRPEIIFNAAISITKDNIISITRRSTSKAFKNAPDASFQVHNRYSFPTVFSILILTLSTVVGSDKITSI